MCKRLDHRRAAGKLRVQCGRKGRCGANSSRLVKEPLQRGPGHPQPHGRGVEVGLCLADRFGQALRFGFALIWPPKVATAGARRNGGPASQSSGCTAPFCITTKRAPLISGADRLGGAARGEERYLGCRLCRRWAAPPAGPPVRDDQWRSSGQHSAPWYQLNTQKFDPVPCVLSTVATRAHCDRIGTKRD